MTTFRDHTALVTGASSGIGLQMATQLAAGGCDLVIAARRIDRLEELARTLRDAHGVTVTVVQADLAQSGAATALYAQATADGRELTICINNAGFGAHHAFADTPADSNRAMVMVNVLAVVELSQLFVDTARTSGRRSYLLNIASTAAFQPIPYIANYTATKHFVLAFSESLAGELRGTNVSVTCLCPGATMTEFFDRADMKLNRLARSTLLEADAVARIGLRAMMRGRRSVVSGIINKINAFLTRLVPRRTAAWIAVKSVGKPPIASEKTG